MEQYHADTLKLVLEETNRDVEAIRAEQAESVTEQAQREAEHAEHVRKIANRTRF